MNRTYAPLIATAAIAVTLTGCGSLGSMAAAGQPSARAGASVAAAAAAAAASSAAAAIASAESAPCTTNSCIVSELDQSLKGAIAQDDAVATKVKCESSTVKNQGSGTFTAWCTTYYSDGTSATGTGTVDTSQNKVTFEPSGD